jgi:selenocysteine-specific elongation factor
MTREEFRAALGKDASTPVVGELLQELANAGELDLRGDKVRIGGGDIKFEGKAAGERDRIDAAFRTAGCAPPDVKEVVAASRDRAIATEVVAALLDQEVLIKVTPDILLHREAWAALLAALRKIAARDKTISVQAIREELGISRKYSVPILEYLDARKVTRREGDVRVLLET